MTHGRIDCSRCGAMVSQCRCPGPHKTDTVSGCVYCVRLDDAEAAETKAARERLKARA